MYASNLYPPNKFPTLDFADPFANDKINGMIREGEKVQSVRHRSLVLRQAGRTCLEVAEKVGKQVSRECEARRNFERVLLQVYSARRAGIGCEVSSGNEDVEGGCRKVK